MKKELKAFERIKNHTLSYTGDIYKTSTDSREMQAKDLDIIESALKENEYLKTELLGQCQELNVKNKVLDIIKRYIQVEDNKVYTTSWEWNLTQEEFDLLKEMFL